MSEVSGSARGNFLQYNLAASRFQAPRHFSPMGSGGPNGPQGSERSMDRQGQGTKLPTNVATRPARPLVPWCRLCCAVQPGLGWAQLQPACRSAGKSTTRTCAKTTAVTARYARLNASPGWPSGLFFASPPELPTHRFGLAVRVRSIILTLCEPSEPPMVAIPRVRTPCLQLRVICQPVEWHPGHLGGSDNQARVSIVGTTSHESTNSTRGHSAICPSMGLWSAHDSMGPPSKSCFQARSRLQRRPTLAC